MNRYEDPAPAIWILAIAAVWAVGAAIGVGGFATGLLP